MTLLASNAFILFRCKFSTNAMEVAMALLRSGVWFATSYEQRISQTQLEDCQEERKTTRRWGRRGKRK